MDKFFIWDKPFRCFANDISGEEVPVFGVFLNGINYNIPVLACYVKYVFAAEKWDTEGNSVDMDKWITNEGITYDFFDEEIQVFMDKAYEESPVYAYVFEADMDFGKEWKTAEYITDPDIARRIHENGRLVDVVLGPDKGVCPGGVKEPDCLNEEPPPIDVHRMAFPQVILSIFCITGQLKETFLPALFFCSNGRGLDSFSATHAVTVSEPADFFQSLLYFFCKPFPTDDNHGSEEKERLVFV